jgi:hypothetical protein
MTIWFNRKTNKISGKCYDSKSISLAFMPQHFFKFSCRTNGAKKGIDKCYDLNINFLGIMFSYTNWDYDCGL